MKKKFFSGLAPLLVIAACVMTPAPALGSAEIVWPSCVAPNCPHVYKNGTFQAEGKILRYIGWGVLKLANNKLGVSECRNIFAGFMVNPVMGGRAEGKVGAWYQYECTNPTCNAPGLIVKPGNTLPWKAEIVENGSKEFFQKTGFKGPTEHKKANPSTEPGQAEFNLNCTNIANFDFFGVNYTKILNNGISIGTIPGESTTQHESMNFSNMRDFETEGETGAVEPETINPGLKSEGFGAQELLEVHNP
jgi:hypothetical protein